MKNILEKTSVILSVLFILGVLGLSLYFCYAGGIFNLVEIQIIGVLCGLGFINLLVYLIRSFKKQPQIISEFSGDIDPEFIHKLVSMIDFMDKGEDNQIGFESFIREAVEKFQRVPTVVEFASACTIWSTRSK